MLNTKETCAYFVHKNTYKIVRKFGFLSLKKMSGSWKVHMFTMTDHHISIQNMFQNLLQCEDSTVRTGVTEYSNPKYTSDMWWMNKVASLIKLLINVIKMRATLILNSRIWQNSFNEYYQYLSTSIKMNCCII